MKHWFVQLIVASILMVGVGCSAKQAQSVIEVPQTNLEQSDNTNDNRYMFCKFCGRVYPDFASKRAHEARCDKNPHHQ